MPAEDSANDSRFKKSAITRLDVPQVPAETFSANSIGILQGQIGIFWKSVQLCQQNC
jgi:hypothetical protein